MQIHDLIKTLNQMSDEELREHVRGIRQRREVLRPAARARVERVEKKTSRARVNKVSDIAANMSEAERLQLIQMLTNGDNE